MSCNYYAVKKKPSIDSPIHIGKSSVGWRFLFVRINYYNLKINTFPQWKKWLEEHIGNDYVILDEYDKEIKLEDFFKLVEEKQKEDNPDNFTYCDNIDGYRFSDDTFL